jgi:hypothetical protein
MMTQANGKHDERLERLLRRWGAEEAARRPSAGAAPFWDRSPEARPSPLRRWLPLAAAFAFLAAGAGFYLASTWFGHAEPSPASPGTGEATEVRHQLDRALADLAEARGLLEDQKQALAAEAARLRQSSDTALAAQREAEKKLAALEARQTATMGLLQQVHLAAATPGEGGIRALQAAARENRLLSRGAELRARIPNQAVRRLFDTQEALLTQLDLLDPGNRGELESFAKLVQSTDLGPQISEALRASGADPAVTQWLIETQLVLSGVKRAG